MKKIISIRIGGDIQRCQDSKLPLFVSFPLQPSSLQYDYEASFCLPLSSLHRRKLLLGEF